MPSLQALNAVPSFSSKLGEALGGGISQGIGANLNQFMQQKKQMTTGTALAEYLGKPEMASALGQLPEQIQVEIAKGHLRNKQEDQSSTEAAQSSINRLSELSGEISASPLPTWAHGAESAAEREEFETQKLSLVAAIRDKVNKGVLTNQKFQFILDSLPKHGDRKAVKQRKLKAVADQLKLSLPGSTGNLRKVEPGTPLSKEEAQNIFKRSGNDPDKARKVAQQLGYEW